MAAENGAESAEECRNPPNHLPQVALRAGTHMRPNRPAPRKRWHGALQLQYPSVCYPQHFLKKNKHTILMCVFLDLLIASYLQSCNHDQVRTVLFHSFN